jgi:epoxyqueuosine reductase QueG
MSELERIEAVIRATGFLLRGGFHPKPDDQVPFLADGRKALTLILIGNAGPAMWQAFSAARQSDHENEPLNAFTRKVVSEIARDHGATALFPFGGPPYLPFQRWAQRAEPVHMSPIGLLIHPEFGLWHAYRGALAFADRLDLPPADYRPNPCSSCHERPCLKGCPVNAFKRNGYDVASCVRHIVSEAGEACRSQGCLARRACPVGQMFAYEAAQATFHMQAFLRAQKDN